MRKTSGLIPQGGSLRYIEKNSEFVPFPACGKTCMEALRFLSVWGIDTYRDIAYNQKVRSLNHFAKIKVIYRPYSNTKFKKAFIAGYATHQYK
ncbi:MAG: hypothetical protein ACP5UV_06230 [Thermoplasmata archaeon]